MIIALEYLHVDQNYKIATIERQIEDRTLKDIFFSQIFLSETTEPFESQTNQAPMSLKFNYFVSMSS